MSSRLIFVCLQSAGQNDCLDCSPGEFANVTGLSVCNLCAPGTFSALRALSTCTLCLKGTYAAQSGPQFPEIS
jgi:hypothetical protein